eukprot:964671-Amphidinium_carterae.1
MVEGRADPTWAPNTRGFDSIQRPSLDHLITITIPIVGHVAVYVHDLLLCGLRLETDALTSAIQKLWTCSSPETVGPASHGAVVPLLRFPGVNIEQDDHGTFGGWIVHQQEYILDIPRATTGEPESYSETQKKVEKKIDHRATEPSIHAKSLPSIIGSILWVSIRTRPDISLAVARASKRIPMLSIKR